MTISNYSFRFCSLALLLALEEKAALIDGAERGKKSGNTMIY